MSQQLNLRPVFFLFLSSLFLIPSGVLLVSSATTQPVFNAAINVSNDSNVAQYPNVQTNGNNVYVVWTEKSHGVLFRSFSISTQAWTPPLSASGLRLSLPGTANYPLMTDSGNYVYVVWSQTTPTNKNLQVYFAASSNGGQTFNQTIKTKVIDATPSTAATTPVIAASGNYVSVAWIAGSQSYVSVSANNGATWTAPFKYSGKHEPQVAVQGANIYAVADAVTLAVSHDAGGSWKLLTLGAGSEPWIAAVGSDVLVAWETKGASSVIDYVFSTNSGVSFSSKGVLSMATPNAWAPMVNISGNTFYVAWRTNPNQSTSQEYVDVSSNLGSSWSGPRAIGVANRDNSWPFTIASSGSTTYIMWNEKLNTVLGNGDWQPLVASSSDGGATWSTPVSLASKATLGAQPEQDIATGAIASMGATAFAVWENNQTTSQIYFSDS